MQVTPSSLQRRLAALETRAGSRAQGIRVQSFPDDVEDVAVGGQAAEDVVVVITGVPLAEPGDFTLDDLVGPVVGAPAAVEVADEVVDVESDCEAEPESGLEPEADPIEVVIPERELVRHSLVPRVTVVPGASHISTGVGSESVPLLRWVRC